MAFSGEGGIRVAAILGATIDEAVMTQAFHDRAEAGRVLARLLQVFIERPHTIILALPRGGVPVGYEVAQALHLPLDLLLVRKLGVPDHEELAMGAIASGGVRVLHRHVVDALDISPAIIDAVAQREWRELERRERAYRDDRPVPMVAGQTIILVDDGLATGTTMRAAAEALRQERAEGIIVAVPVASSQACTELREVANEVVCARTPEDFRAVGRWYENFEQTTDEEVRSLLAQAWHQTAPAMSHST